MKKTTFPMIAAFALFVAAPAFAQQPTPSPSPNPPSPTAAPAPMTQEPKAARAEVASGELVKVDVDAKTISIKGADGAETVFSYNDRTDVGGGARDGVAGLATKAGTQVTVHFTSDMGTKTATKIEVKGDKADKK
jgi:hypothetical protein